MISVDGLGFSYGSGAAILDRVAFDAAAGRCVAVLGNNGAGKSTLVKCVARILEPGSGSVYVDGEDAASLGRRELARRVAYVAQRGSHDRLTVFDSVLLGRTPHMGYEPGREDLDIVALHARARQAFLERGLPVFDEIRSALRAVGHMNRYYGGKEGNP